MLRSNSLVEQRDSGIFACKTPFMIGFSAFATVIVGCMAVNAALAGAECRAALEPRPAATPHAHGPADTTLPAGALRVLAASACSVDRLSLVLGPGGLATCAATRARRGPAHQPAGLPCVRTKPQKAGAAGLRLSGINDRMQHFVCVRRSHPGPPGRPVAPPGPPWTPGHPAAASAQISNGPADPPRRKGGRCGRQAGLARPGGGLTGKAARSRPAKRCAVLKSAASGP